ncbi:MAG: hypothetical protein AAF570_06035, partial [Bacteroidota bacterium]
MRIKNTLVGLWTMLLVFAGSAFAGNIEHQIYLEKDSIQAGKEVWMSDPTWVEEVQNPGQFASSRRNEVRLVYGRDQRTDLDGAKWSMKVKYTLFFTGANIAPVQDSLEIGHDVGRHDYAEARSYAPGAPTVRLRIDGVETTSTTPIPPDIRLELATKTERYQFFDNGLTPTLDFAAADQTLRWGYVAGAEEYEIEYSWIDAYSSQTVNEAFERAVRFASTENYYRPDLTYREGTVYFRIRAVGRFINNVGSDYSYKKYGKWSAPVAYQINGQNSFEADKNLVYTTTFTEGGKYKKVMSYADGAGKSRQSLTHLSSDSSTVLTQTEYDHEGRGVITTIPIPKPGINLHFDNSLNEDLSNAVFAPPYFDNGTSAPLSDQTGAGRYFSPNNNHGGIARDYIPDAQGFPYSRVVFENDATGRIAAQGGVGPDHQPGSGHEVRFFYGDASATQLGRMFGGNVGNANHYLKKMSTDPNGQVSIAWQDQSEKVIATALAGDSPNNVVALDYIPTEKWTESLNENTYLDKENLVSVTQRTFLNESPNKVYEFHWDLSAPMRQIECLCHDCEYQLEISIIGPNGDSVDLGGTNLIEQHIDNPTTSCNNPFYVTSLDFSAQFAEIGDYTLTKTLKAVEVDVDILLDSLEVCPNFPSLQTLIDSFVSNIDTTICDDTCQSKIPIWGSVDQGLAGITGYDTISDNCNGIGWIGPNDIVQTECEAIYQNMVQQLAPGGWLHNPTDWATLNNDSTLIRQYVELNHREWCLYQRCIADAESRYFDMAAATMGTYQEAVDHGYWNDPAVPGSGNLSGNQSFD